MLNLRDSILVAVAKAGQANVSAVVDTLANPFGRNTVSSILWTMVDAGVLKAEGARGTEYSGWYVEVNQ